MFRIAVIGGGIGGLFAALSIHHHCKSSDIQIDVYEQATEYTEIGAGVGIGANAAALMAKLGLTEDMLKIGGHMDDIWLTFRRYDNGGEVHTIMNPANTKIPHISMHRAEFIDLLVRAVKRQGAATLHTNKRCQSIEDQGDTMLVTFADGTTTSANLVVGADGIHSAVRSHYLKDTAQYGGMLVYRGLCDIDKIKDSWPLSTYGALYMGHDKHFLTFPICQDKVMNVVAFVSTPFEKLGDTTESWTLAGDKADIEREYKDFAPEIQAVIQNMDANPLKWILFDRKSSPDWIFSGGKVALLGDAAHAMCPHQGAGAGQSLEDGYVLGRALQEYLQPPGGVRNHTLEQCLRLYHIIRAPRAERVQMTSRQAGDLYQMKAEEFAGLSFDDALPVAKAMIQDRMKWIWTVDIDNVYEQARTEWQQSKATL